MWLTQTPTHLIALRRIRIRKYHVKAALAYGGALLMGADAMTALAPVLFPHAAVVLASVEGGASLCGKCGAAASGFAAFFDRIIASAVAQETGVTLPT